MEQKSDRFDVVVTILIALVTAFGAVVTWRASLASAAAGDTEQQGLLDTLTQEEGLAAHETRLFTDMQYFVRYRQHEEIARRLRRDETAARVRGEIALADDLAHEAELHEELAANQADFFDTDYALPDGAFDEARYLSDLQLSDDKINGLDPAAIFAEADAYQEQAKRLVGLISLLTVALFFYTLSQITERRVKYPLAALGTLVFFGTAVLFVAVERMMG